MIREILSKNQIKITKQRIEVLEYLKKKKKVSLKTLIKDNKEINLSTIYRILELFIKKNIITKIYDQEPYYLFNINDHKHYIECIKCHFKEELETCPYNLIALKGYKINENEIIKGICLNCQKKKKIGIFVGSFNPITKAHLQIGAYLYQNKILDLIVYVPCNSLKKNNLINIVDRYNMIKEVVSEYNYLKVDDIEIVNGEKNFSRRDLDMLKLKYENDLYIVLGDDNFLNLDKWEDYLDILKNYKFIIIKRLGIDLEKIIKEKYFNYQDRFLIIDKQSDVSSTLVREKLKNNLEVDNYLDQKVINYINKNRLYH